MHSGFPEAQSYVLASAAMTEDDIRLEIERLINSGFKPKIAPPGTAIVANDHGVDIIPTTIRRPAGCVRDMPAGFSLSAAVHWIASDGTFDEPDDLAMNGAAKELVGLLTSGEVVAYGLDHSGQRLPVPAHEFLEASSFLPAEKEIDTLNDGAPRLVWNFTLDSDRHDRIERYFLPIWDRIIIESTALLDRWPADPSPLIAPEIAENNFRHKANKKNNQCSPGRPPKQMKMVKAKLIGEYKSGKDITKYTPSEMSKKWDAHRDTCSYAQREALLEIANNSKSNFPASK